MVSGGADGVRKSLIIHLDKLLETAILLNSYIIAFYGMA